MDSLGDLHLILNSNIRAPMPVTWNLVIHHLRYVGCVQQFFLARSPLKCAQSVVLKSMTDRVVRIPSRSSLIWTLLMMDLGYKFRQTMSNPTPTVRCLLRYSMNGVLNRTAMSLRPMLHGPTKHGLGVTSAGATIACGVGHYRACSAIKLGPWQRRGYSADVARLSKAFA